MKLLPEDHDETELLEKPFFGYLKGKHCENFHKTLEDYLFTYCDFIKGKHALTKQQLENYRWIFDNRFAHRKGFSVIDHEGAVSYEMQVKILAGGKEEFVSIKCTGAAAPYRYKCPNTAYRMLLMSYPDISDEDLRIKGSKEPSNI